MKKIKVIMKHNIVHVVGDKNLVIWDDGSKAVGDSKETKSWIKQKGVATVYLLE